MEKGTPVRKPNASTADLLTWTENPPEYSPASASSARPHQPSDGIRKVVFGGQVTDEEVEELNKRKPCSGYKMKEITGSGIFKANGETELSEYEDVDHTPVGKTGVRMYQQALSGMSNISFGEEEAVLPKKPTTVAEAAKQRELSGSLDSESEDKLKKQISMGKKKELSGHDIFAPPPEIQPRSSVPRPLALRESITIGVGDHSGDERGIGSVEEHSMKTAKKVPEKKLNELNGNNIFKEEGEGELKSAEKALSSAKLREMSGSNIFAADEKVEHRDYFGGVRKPPGGESSIALV